MSNRKVLFNSILSLIVIITLQIALLAQPYKSAINIVRQGWESNAKIGLDSISNLVVNPQVGSGENRLVFGTNIGIYANLNSDRFSWNNSLNTAFSIQKTGKSYLKNYPNIKMPFQKNNSTLRMLLSYKNTIPIHLEESINVGRFDFEWLNELDIKLWKSLSLAIISNLVYNNNVFIQKTNKELPTGLEEEYSRAISYFQQLLISYKVDFLIF